MRALCDDMATLDDVGARGGELAERLSVIGDFHARVATAEAWIESRLGEIDVDAARLHAVAAINTRLEAGRGLAELTDWNERKLQRFIATSYGTTPATMRCFWRFERLRRALLDGEGDLGALAIDHGYADQAHLAREFRRFAGLSVSAWRAETASP